MILSPNPTQTFFALNIQSATDEPVQINVFSIDGRKTDYLKAKPGQLLQLGENYHKGSYLFEVRQGTQRVTVTGMKL